MLKRDKSFRIRYGQWKDWRKRNHGSIFYQLAVLFGLTDSDFDMTYLPRYSRKM